MSFEDADCLCTNLADVYLDKSGEAIENALEKAETAEDTLSQ